MTVVDKESILKNLSFREACSGDEKAINEFFAAMGGESRSLFNRREYNQRGILKYCQKPDKTRRYWIVEAEGEMVGYVFFLDFNTSVPELGLAVRDDLRGLHIGRELVAFAQKYAREAGKGGITLTTHLANVRGQALYEHMGFKNVGLCKNGSELFYLYRYLD